MSKSLGGAVAAALVAALTWFAFDGWESTPGEPAAAVSDWLVTVQDSEQPEVARTAVSTSPSGGSRTALQVPTGATAATAPQAFAVRSSAGIPLARIEVELQPRRWTWRDLDGDPLELKLGERARAVRAAGHLAAAIDDGAPSVSLEPDALLVIEGECLESVEITFPPPDMFGHQFVGGSTTAARWALAVSSTRRSGPVHLTVTAADLERVFLEFEPGAGERAIWKLPCVERRPTRPLDVRVVRPAGLPPGSVELSLTLVAPFQGYASSIEEYAWGRAVFPAARRIHHGARVEADAILVELESVPVGDPLSLTARDEVSGAVGRTFFAHDGAPVEIELVPPITIEGRIAVAFGIEPPPRAYFRFHHHRADEEPSEGWWYSGGRDIELGGEGQFRLLSPEVVMPQPDSPLLPPRIVELRIQAPGFEALEVQRIVESGRVECGTLTLVPLGEPDLVLAPGHGLEAWRAQVTYLRFNRDPHLVLEVGEAHQRADGTLALRWTPEDAPGGPLQPAARARRRGGSHDTSGAHLDESRARPLRIERRIRATRRRRVRARQARELPPGRRVRSAATRLRGLGRRVALAGDRYSGRLAQPGCRGRDPDARVRGPGRRRRALVVADGQASGVHSAPWRDCRGCRHGLVTQGAFDVGRQLRG